MVTDSFLISAKAMSEANSVPKWDKLETEWNNFFKYGKDVL